MSVASMAQLAGNDAPEPVNSADLLVKYIPSEAIAVYIGALGILVPAADATSWQIQIVRLICFGAGFVIATIIAFANLDTSGISGPREVLRRQLVVSGLAAVAFFLYAGAMPSFFVQGTLLTINSTQWFAAAAVFSASILPLVATRLGVRQQTSAPAPAAPAPPAAPAAHP